jgi:hypothetical protein
VPQPTAELNHRHPNQVLHRQPHHEQIKQIRQARKALSQK